MLSRAGAWLALLEALAFSWTLCLLLLATFVWPAWFPAVVVRLAWCGLFLFWVTETVRGQWAVARWDCEPSDQADRVLGEAQTEYLKGNWFEAEAALLELLQLQPRDVEAQLLLVGVLRRTKRWSAALRRLDQLAAQETAAPWYFEIARERALIHSAMQEADCEQAATGAAEEEVAGSVEASIDADACTSEADIDRPQLLQDSQGTDKLS